MRSKIENKINSNAAIFNLTALWALSEAFLDGVLYAFKVPFKGMILGNIAVIIITLIAFFLLKEKL